MGIRSEYKGDGIYVYHWEGVIHHQDVLDGQYKELEHAKAHGITRHYQIINMTEIQTISWNIPAFTEVIGANPHIVAITLVNPPTHILVATHVIHTFFPKIEWDVQDSVENAVLNARARVARLQEQ